MSQIQTQSYADIYLEARDTPGTGRYRPNVLTRNTAICARVTGSVGQKLPLPHPPVIPSAAIASIQSTAKLPSGTSVNTPVPGGGM